MLRFDFAVRHQYLEIVMFKLVIAILVAAATSQEPQVAATATIMPAFSSEQECKDAAKELVPQVMQQFWIKTQVKPVGAHVTCAPADEKPKQDNTI
jgi:hypothetical protein